MRTAEDPCNDQLFKVSRDQRRSVLPKPRSSSRRTDDDAYSVVTPVLRAGAEAKEKARGPPPYRQRGGFVPRYPEDFGDGGSFAEIHVAQYPLDMGRSKGAEYGKELLAVQVDAQGRVQYDVIARQGHAKDRIVYASLKDMVPSAVEGDDLSRPTQEQIERTADETRAALERIVSVKIQAAQPQQNANRRGPDGGAQGEQQQQLIRYTASQTGGNFDAQKERVVRLVQMAQDPLDPPKFLHRKLPRPPPSPPPPVLHSPPRKASAREQLAWKVPPCISSWKNPKGYTIPLDKRFAHDGRGLQEAVMNDNFSRFAEALYVAEQHAREEVEQRSAMQLKLLERERLDKEERLRQIALRVRESAAASPDGFGPDGSDSPVGAVGAIGSVGPVGSVSPANNATHKREQSTTSHRGSRKTDTRGSDEERRRREVDDPAPSSSSVQERNALRRERELERHQERRKRPRAVGDDRRDISEKVALGVTVPSAAKESLYDARLFNRSEGLAAGFHDEEAYDVYDRPLFSGAATAAIYNPAAASNDSDEYSQERVSKMLSTSKFTSAAPSSSSSTTTAAAAADKKSGSSGPVEFEKDPFGLDDFLSGAKKGKQ